MDEMKLSQDRQEVLARIDEYEKKGWFDKDVTGYYLVFVIVCLAQCYGLYHAKLIYRRR